MWDSFKAWWDSFTNNGLTITLTSIGGIILTVLVVMSKTSIGKKALNFLTNKFDAVSKKFEELKKSFAEYKEDTEKKLNAYKEEYAEKAKQSENKVTAVFVEYEGFKNDVYKMLEKIPNAKVQEQLQIVKQNADDREKEIKNLLGDTYGDIKVNLQSTYAEAVEDLKSKSADLEAKYKEAEQFLDKLKKMAHDLENSEKVEEESDERNNEDTDTTKEEIE